LASCFGCEGTHPEGPDDEIGEGTVFALEVLHLQPLREERLWASQYPTGDTDAKTPLSFLALQPIRQDT
jgi:hypothetical protein